MHQLDETLGELEAGIDALESSDEFEMLGENEYEWAGEADSEAVFDEVEEMELAAALLEIQSEEELEEFLGKLVRRAGKAIGGFVKGPVGKALGGVLKKVAKTALPIAGTALGNLVAPGIGGMIGGKLASAAGGMFGLELEGMSPQDQEFEVARRVVRLAGEATRQAAQMPANGSPVNAAKDAVVAAAAQHAPGLAGSAAPAGAKGAAGNGAGRKPCNCGRGRGAYGNGARAGAGGAMGRGGAGGYGAGRAAGYGGALPGGPRARPGGAAGAGGRGMGERGTWVRRGNSVVLSWG